MRHTGLWSTRGEPDVAIARLGRRGDVDDDDAVVVGQDVPSSVWRLLFDVAAIVTFFMDGGANDECGGNEWIDADRKLLE